MIHRFRDEVFVLLAVLMPVCVPNAFGQAVVSEQTPSFEVSTIKPSGPDSGSGLTVRFLPGGSFAARNASVRLLIKIAYNLNDDEVSGGPAWITSRKFDIYAKPDPSTVDAAASDNTQTRLRLQAILKDRFQLHLRREMKEMSTYALLVAKNGPKLTKSVAPDSVVHFQGGQGNISASNATLDQLTAAVEDWVGHPVQNTTGLDGRYDFKLQWTPDATAPNPGSSPTPPDDSGPSIFTALQEQLGLRLQARKIQAPCQFVESVELPSEN
jgi:uncharacterized protein (TIGR03435 family)